MVASYAYRDFFSVGMVMVRLMLRNSSLAVPVTNPGNGSTACDYDNDGDLTSLWQPIIVWKMVTMPCGKMTAMRTSPMLRNNGFHASTGNYYQSSTGYGTDPEPDTASSDYMGSNGFGIDCGDVNNDGYLDIFMSTISHPSNSDYSRKWSDPTQLLINQGPDGDYGFVNEFQERGLPFNEGDVDAALVDFDNDGRFDLSLSRDKKYENNYDDIDQKAWLV